MRLDAVDITPKTYQGVKLAILELSVTSAKLEALAKNHLGDIVFVGVLKRITNKPWTIPMPFSKVGGVIIGAYASGEGCTVVFRAHPVEDLLCIDIQEVKSSDEIFPLAVVDKMGKVLSHNLDCHYLRPAAAIPRGGEVNNLLFSSDQRLLVYDFDRVVLDVHSDFQHIQIFNSTQFGNTLVIDGHVYVSACDLDALRKFMRKGIESYRDKDALILGGGDGTLLNELLHENPRFVTLVDIDRLVLEICRRYMRDSCGDALDHFEGPRHKIVIGDCFAMLDKFAEAGQKFDFIFNDLTDVPVVEGNKHKEDEFWELVVTLLDKSLKVLRPGGKLMNHLVGVCSKEIIDRYETILGDRELFFEKKIEMVPSFLEPWVFYTITKSSPVMVRRQSFIPHVNVCKRRASLQLAIMDPTLFNRDHNNNHP